MAESLADDFYAALQDAAKKKQTTGTGTTSHLPVSGSKSRGLSAPSLDEHRQNGNENYRLPNQRSNVSSWRKEMVQNQTEKNTYQRSNLRSWRKETMHNQTEKNTQAHGISKYQRVSDNRENTSKNIEYNLLSIQNKNSDENRSLLQHRRESLNTGTSFSKDTDSHQKSYLFRQNHKSLIQEDQNVVSDTTGKKAKEISFEENPELKDQIKDKWIEKLAKKEPSQIVMDLTNRKLCFESILKQQLKPSNLMLVVNILSKLSKASLEQNTFTLLSLSCHQSFLDQLSKYIAIIPLEENKMGKDITENFLGDLMTFLETIIIHLPRTAVDSFQNIFMMADAMIKCSNIYNEDTNKRFKYLKEKYELCLEKEENKQFKENTGINKQVPVPVQELPEGEICFRDVSILNEEDILAAEPGFIRPNIVNGAYISVDHYLDVQFRLLREDFLSPLREGITEYRHMADKKLKKIDNIRIYHKVIFLNPRITRGQLGLTVSFEQQNKFKNVVWEHSKRFMFGSLLLFSRDNFDTIIFATVMDRDVTDLKKGHIVVQLKGTAVTNDLFRDEFVMAEAEVYFEPYYHILKALQNMDNDNFPMKKYIVHAQMSATPPEYMCAMTNCILDIDGHSVSVLKDESWPGSSEMDLDFSQYSALKYALTKEFVVIQGPPGTGKTFIGLKVVTALLRNWQIWYVQSPILVLCYTNHALDQFLEGIIFSMGENEEILGRIVRIGGQSRSKMLERFNLKNKRKGKNRDLSLLLKVMHCVKNYFMSYLETIQNNLEIIVCQKGIIPLSFLKALGIVDEYFGTFECSDPKIVEQQFIEWLVHGIYDNVDPFEAEEDNENHGSNIAEDNIHHEESRQIPNIHTAINWATLCEMIRRCRPKYEDDDLTDYDSDPYYYNEWNFDKYRDRYENAMHRSLMYMRRYRSRHLWYLLEESIYMRFLDLNENTKIPPVKLSEMEMDLNKSEMEIQRIEQLIWTLQSQTQLDPAIPGRICVLMNMHEDLSMRLKYIKRELNKKERSDKRTLDSLLQQENLWALQGDERWILYRHWVDRARNILLEEMKRVEEHLYRITMMLEEVYQICDQDILENSLVVGITTTGAARLQSQFQKLQPKIVIVEEAAEVLESHIVASVTKHCEHLILIGDHQQLRPSPAVFALARDYNFDISLFERMLKNGIHCETLKFQHRMRPEIARLITPSIYPDLQNDNSVLKFEKIKGVLNSVFFITHEYSEDDVADMSSHRNAHEGDFLIALCRYLRLQGYSASQITILATYSAQMFYLQSEQKKFSELDDVKITVVDNFQGEENDIILLSLVRSNVEANIGFLKVENRVCVALSRARMGLYIIGNMENLTRSSKIWPKIKQTLKSQDGIGPYLTLRCQVHASQFTSVSNAADFYSLLKDGCPQPCGTELLCGHICNKSCHLDNREHEGYRCLEPCSRTPESCKAKHKCQKNCYKECGDCRTLVPKTLPCGHTVDIHCSISADTYSCQVEVEVELSYCGHTVKKPCHSDPKSFPCSHSCEERLPCGHSCESKCHITDDRDHLQYKCKKPCTARNKDCKEDHRCMKLCHEKCGNCMISVQRQLSLCGHTVNMPCSQNIETYLCYKNCEKILPCGHPCPNNCSAKCGNCPFKVEKIIDTCGHSLRVKCSEKPNPELCTSPCKKILPCGHNCTSVCSAQCTRVCQQSVPSRVESQCGHVVHIPCYMQKQVLAPDSQELLFRCQAQCGMLLDCKHQCTGTCGECMQGRIHKPCKITCERMLVCGHSCTSICADDCPPCNRTCRYKCKHTKCSRKCGQLCSQCKEPCEWSCKHKRCTKLCYEECDRVPCNEPCDKLLPCKHPCIGFCGETCPPLCRICDEDKMSEMFGTEDQPDARFVYLEDCKHILQEKELEQLHVADREIKLKECPRCRIPIMRTQRYVNTVKKFFQNVCRVKYLFFEKIRKVEAGRDELKGKLKCIKLSIKEAPEEYANMFTKLESWLKPGAHAVDTGTIRIQFEIFSQLFDCYEGVKILEHQSQIQIVCNLNMLLHVVKKRERKISRQEIVDFDMEIERLQKLCHMFKIRNDSNIRENWNAEVKEQYEAAFIVVHSPHKFSNAQDMKLQNCLEELFTTLKDTIDAKEKTTLNLHFVHLKNSLEYMDQEVKKRADVVNKKLVNVQTTELNVMQEDLKKMVKKSADSEVEDSDTEKTHSLPQEVEDSDTEKTHSLPQEVEDSDTEKTHSLPQEKIDSKGKEQNSKTLEFIHVIEVLIQTTNKVLSSEEVNTLKTYILETKDTLKKLNKVTTDIMSCFKKKGTDKWIQDSNMLKNKVENLKKIVIMVANAKYKIVCLEREFQNFSKVMTRVSETEKTDDTNIEVFQMKKFLRDLHDAVRKNETYGELFTVAFSKELYNAMCKLNEVADKIIDVKRNEAKKIEELKSNLKRNNSVKKESLKPVNFQQSHWLICPKNHIYLTTEQEKCCVCDM